MATEKSIGETGMSSYEVKANRMSDNPQITRYAVCDGVDSGGAGVNVAVDAPQQAPNDMLESQNTPHDIPHEIDVSYEVIQKVPHSRHYACQDAQQSPNDIQQGVVPHDISHEVPLSMPPVIPHESADEVVLDPRNIKVPVTEVTAEPNNNAKKHPLPRSALKNVSVSLGETNGNGRQAEDVIIAQFDNPAFDAELVTSKMSFSDVVKTVMREPIETDYHPFGRGNLYASVFNKTHKIQRDEFGHLFVWVLVMAIVLGLAVGVIVMSIAYGSNRAQLAAADGLRDNIANVTEANL